MSFHVPHKYRIRVGKMASTDDDGNNGAFAIRMRNGSRNEARIYQLIASDGGGWEHVSVMLAAKDRTPTWDEMCKLKALFWDDEDCVVQYHPPRSDYINNARYVLHMWRPTAETLPRPPSWMVGIKELNVTVDEEGGE